MTTSKRGNRRRSVLLSITPMKLSISPRNAAASAAIAADFARASFAVSAVACAMSRTRSMRPQVSTRTSYLRPLPADSRARRASG